MKIHNDKYEYTNTQCTISTGIANSSSSIHQEYMYSKYISDKFRHFPLSCTPLCKNIDFSKNILRDYSTSLSILDTTTICKNTLLNMNTNMFTPVKISNSTTVNENVSTKIPITELKEPPIQFDNSSIHRYKPVTISLPPIDKKDILSLNKFNYCYTKYASSMEIIIADIITESHYETCESIHTKLLFGQMCYALCMQKQGGVFIIKISDCFMESTMDILYILCGFYENVYITKPDTSSPTTSEKYIVCKNFLFKNTDIFGEYIQCAFSSITKISIQLTIRRFLTIPIPITFLNKIEEFNAILGQHQLDAIHQTILFIDNKSNQKQDKFDKIMKNSIQKCIQWCIKYNIPYNHSLQTTSNSITDTKNNILCSRIGLVSTCTLIK